MDDYSLDIKVTCQNHIMKTASKATEGHPWRSWRIRLVAIENNRERKGRLSQLLDHVEYLLHPTFENPRRVAMKEPYSLQEKGWGEFDLRIILYFKNNLGVEPENILFDLNFREFSYSFTHTTYFQHPSADLIRALTQPLPTASSSHQDDHHHHTSSPSLSSIYANDHHHKKRRTTSPLITHNKKLSRTPPSAITSPAQFSDGSLTPSSYNMKYPTSPSTIVTQMLNNGHDATDDLLYNKSSDSRHLEGVVVDDIYDEKDLDNLNPIHHSFVHNKTTRLAWGIPEGLDILELARRLSSRTIEQTEEIKAIIKSHKRDDMLMEENDDEFVVDLYSLGPELLDLLWNYTEKKMMSSSHSPFSLVQANTNMVEEY
ncbi:MAG: yeats family-domain-containing protein [Benjaminiella poitrasii]|nr:MAG: yeats family-domain-containing protein [Benjaminiella poitrasii]